MAWGKWGRSQGKGGIPLLSDSSLQWEVATLPAVAAVLCGRRGAQRQFSRAACVTLCFTARELHLESLCQTPSLITGTFDPACKILQRKHSGRKNKWANFPFRGRAGRRLGYPCQLPAGAGERTASVEENQRWLVSSCLQVLLDVAVSALALSW